MDTEQNVQTVRRVYAAMSHGNMQGVLDLMSDDVDFLFVGSSDVLPYAGHHRGHAEVLELFEMMDELVEVEHVEAGTFIAGGDDVVVLGHERAHGKDSGVSYETDWAQVYTVRGGKITHVREFTDTGSIAAALGLLSNSCASPY